MKYTVVLLRPERICEVPYGQDIYIALVESTNTKAALAAAQLEVSKVDKKDSGIYTPPKDYLLCCMFQEHMTAALYGWQT